MDQQIENGHLARDPGIMHAEVGKMIDDLVVPAELALVHQDRQRRGGEGLAGGAGGEDGVRVHRFRRPEPAHAIAFGLHDPAVFDDGDRHARHIVLLQRLFHVGIETGGRCGRCGRGRAKTRRDDQDLQPFRNGKHDGLPTQVG
jgi:hypothetical protein